MSKIHLASKSPRREEILKSLGLDFDIIISSVDENIDAVNPVKYVEELALKKATAVYEKTGGIVIGADTVVVCDNKIIGKPSNNADAFNILKGLIGKTHEVYTGVCIIEKGIPKVDYSLSKVEFKNLSDDEIWEYIKKYKPLDKAGAYGIQDKVLVKSFTGSYTNILGLPEEIIKKYFDLN